MRDFDWKRPTTYDASAKSAFHRAARRQLKQLANELGFATGTYDLRSNKAGPAVSGEITLHHDDIYLQVSQALGGIDRSILIRTCEGRRDYSGGQNHFAALEGLNDGELPRLAAFCRRIMEQKLGHSNEDPGYNAFLGTERDMPRSGSQSPRP